MWVFIMSDVIEVRAKFSTVIVIGLTTKHADYCNIFNVLLNDCDTWYLFRSVKCNFLFFFS